MPPGGAYGQRQTRQCRHLCPSVLYGVLWRCLVVGIRNTKQIENVARSPLLHHLSSTVGGLAVIRAYGKERMMIERSGLAL